MRPLRPGSEAEMAALFLRTELFSDRYGAGIRALLKRDGVPEQELVHEVGYTPGGVGRNCRR